MTGVARITKLDFFIMKSQGISYLSLVAVILLFGLMGSSITVLCITGAWFIALMATNIFAIQEKNHLDRLYGSVCVSLNEARSWTIHLCVSELLHQHGCNYYPISRLCAVSKSYIRCA